MSVFDFLKRRRRAAITAEPFPEAWRATLASNVPYVAKLDDAERTELERLVQIFVAEKSFEGAGGLEMTDEIKITIAAQACLLLLHRDSDVYPGLVSIVVYPAAYKARGVKRRGEGGVVLEGDEGRGGEAWNGGDLVVLAWDHVKRGARDVHDGHNVVLHEFAHQLDGEDGAMDGAPDLGEGSRYTAWARVLGDEYEELCARLRGSDIDAYGATNPQEFFAVITEMFFEKGPQMKRRHPELYEQLRAFYRQDPAARV